MPLKARISGLAVVPASVPLSIVTSAGMPAKALVVAVKETAVNSRRRIAIPPQRPSPYRVAAPPVRTYNRARLDFMQPFYANVLRLSKPRGPWNPKVPPHVGGDASWVESTRVLGP